MRYSQIAQDLNAHEKSKSTVIDIFAGAGGNTIAFALSGRWESVIGIERDAATLACAQNNAVVYGVEDYITWIHGDSFEYLQLLKENPDKLAKEIRPTLDNTIIFASPPWGGPGYRTDEIFDLRTMEPYNLEKLHSAVSFLDHALYLPRTSDLRQLAACGPGDEKMDVVQYCMQGASKALVAYIPGQKLPIK
jgi:trimethylguanosine synthase